MSVAAGLTDVKNEKLGFRFRLLASLARKDSWKHGGPCGGRAGRIKEKSTVLSGIAQENSTVLCGIAICSVP